MFPAMLKFSAEKKRNKNLNLNISSMEQSMFNMIRHKLCDSQPKFIGQKITYPLLYLII